MDEEPLNPPDDDEIDLKEVILVLLGAWRWIAIATLAGGLAALATSLLLPKQYKASAAIVLTKPDIVFRFDPRITTEVEAPRGSGIPDLALSDGILQQIVDSSGAETMSPEDREPDQLRGKLEARLSDTVLGLTVRGDDAQGVTALANEWAEAVVGLLNDLYAPSSRSQGLFEAQAEEALGRWKSSQQALTNFQATNPEQILERRLSAQGATQAGYLEAHRVLGLVLLDAKALQARLEDRTLVDRASLREDLASLLLTAESLSAVRDSAPIQLQVVGQSASLLDESPEQQAQYLAGFVDSLETQRASLDAEAANMEGEIYELQGQLAQAQEERARLEQERDLAQEAYEALARKALETRLAAQDEDTVARVASLAAIPSKPTGPRVGLNIALGCALGLMIGLVWVIGAEWWLAASRAPIPADKA